MTALETEHELKSREIPPRVRNPMDTDYCIYCDTVLPEGMGNEPVPTATDNQVWARLAEYHQPDCEWIITKAHRLEL
jgi:hypothetical protein